MAHRRGRGGFKAPAPKKNGTSITDSSPSRWAIWFAVDGDLRFISHHDTMRAMEFAATRARLPLRYSQGFNPHPVMSLPLPRPVSVASRGELLVLSLDGPVEDVSYDSTGDNATTAQADRLLQRLQRQAPRGMVFTKASVLPGNGAPQPSRVNYRLTLPPAEIGIIPRRLSELDKQEHWGVERLISPKGRRPFQPMNKTEIDIRPLTSSLRLEGSDLCWSALPRGSAWARPGEVLRLLGLEERTNLANVVRMSAEYEFPAASHVNMAPDGASDDRAGDEGT